MQTVIIVIITIFSILINIAGFGNHGKNRFKN